ncbi:GntR family transcriptional regulator [Clostridium celatum]|uniref:UbiC transcription regulator-associated domain protein n=1 Tax=Clostridium celatum DSM 1785 TaxID=545697 RepID=L1QNF3_9CLOT|nr:GntR family transcriptional regulator [Clostridium celatum]EKY29097.1 UbiC transcription regulator-associated domain protein [Clostridium celatum DSM 1785]MCE9654349.1 GntR family transcriptional regulator [Clostridium celatum]MDU3724640.1 GntR family transcriptional regulator [Clostridium celatum]MDY3359458.1 GntR family transcriptional regulator [Clostridium celatum]
MKEPIYIKIEKYLKELIDSGKIKPGELLPSENQLTEEFNVTRMTVRSAFNNLVKEGYITRKRGIGSIVLGNRISDNIGAVESYTNEMSNKGYEITTKLVSFGIIEADHYIKDKLGLELSENVWEVKRVRYAEKEPVSYMITYMPVKMFPNLKRDNCNSLYKYINECGFKISTAQRVVEAVIANEELMELLELEYEAPILHIEQVGILTTGEAFEYSHTYHYGYKLTLNAVAENY